MQFAQPAIMGILNVTPDSFSDGGVFFDCNSAVKHALKMIEDGADIIDIGGESSRPGSEPVSAEEELQRVIPVIKALRNGVAGFSLRQNVEATFRSPQLNGGLKAAATIKPATPNIKNNIPISIDTTKAVVAAKAIEAGANMINDISAGTFDPEMLATAAHANVPICLMHMRGNPKTMQTGEIHYNDVVGEISEYLEGRIATALKAGCKRENIIIDPGIGFGKTVEHNITILKELFRFKLLGCPTLRPSSGHALVGTISPASATTSRRTKKKAGRPKLGCPILIGTSRKSFIGHLLSGLKPQERLEGTLATIGIAVQNGANILRVHDVAEVRRYLAVFVSILYPQDKGDSPPSEWGLSPSS